MTDWTFVLSTAIVCAFWFACLSFLVWRPHRHEWAERERVYAAGEAQTFETKRATPETIAMGMALTMGQTTILSTCKKCGRTSTTTVIGDARKAADDGPV